MSFTRDNEHFLKFGLQIPLQGLAVAEMHTKYVNEIREEARRRIRLYYQCVKNDIPHKTSFYKELLEIFGSLEQQFLIYSIYFESDLELIDFELDYSNLEFSGFNKAGIRNYFKTKGASTIERYLRQYFTETLNLSHEEWVGKGSSRNPVTNKLIFWVKDKITNESKDSELKGFVLNYTKFWNIYFCKPYDIVKAIILIHKLNGIYCEIDPQELTLDLNALLIELNKFIEELLPDVYNSPLTDWSQSSEVVKIDPDLSHLDTQSYLKKRTKFQEALTINSYFFQDFGTLSWPDLLLESFSAPPTVQLAYLKEIKKRHLRNDVPKFNDIDKFMKMMSLIEAPFNKAALDCISTPNYFYFL